MPRKHFMFSLCIHLHKPYLLKAEDGREITQSDYFANLGVTADNELEARSIIQATVEDGTIDWDESACEEVDLLKYDPTIYKRCSDPNEKGVWFKGSKFLYSEKNN